jgi:hypothetical protein
MKRFGWVLVAFCASVAAACSGQPLGKHGAGGRGGEGFGKPIGGAGGGASGISGAAGAAGSDAGALADTAAAAGSESFDAGALGGAPAADAGAAGGAGRIVDAAAADVVVESTPDGAVTLEAGVDMGVDLPDVADASADVACLLTLNDGGANAPAAACLQPTKPTSFCSITMEAIDPATLCPGEASCPTTLVARLACDGDLANPQMSLVPRADGAAIMMDVGSPASDDQYDGEVFTIESGGTSHVDRFPLLLDGLLTGDRAGVVNFFTGSPTGGWRFRQVASSWLREDIPADPPAEFPEVTAARALDDEHAFAAVNAGGNVQLAARDPAGWHTTAVNGTVVTEFGVTLEVDAAGHPWLATVGAHDDSGKEFLDVVSSAGALDTIGDIDSSFFPPPLALLPGGLAGSDTRPTVAFRQADGIHVAGPTGDSGWSQLVVPGSVSEAVDTTQCPGITDTVYGAVCQADSCDEHTKGSASGLGLARTTAGNTYAAWLTIDATDTYELAHQQVGCGQSCGCGRGGLMSRAGSSDLVVQRVPVDGVSWPPPLRFHFADVTDGMGMIAMAARGDKLLVAVYVGVDNSQLDVRYLEIDPP